MLLSREKAAIPQSPGQFGRSDKPEEMEVPTIESFFKNRDYKGALTLIDFEARINVSFNCFVNKENYRWMSKFLGNGYQKV